MAWILSRVDLFFLAVSTLDSIKRRNGENQAGKSRKAAERSSCETSSTSDASMARSV